MENDVSVNITKSEILFKSFFIKHNMPLSAANHAGNLFRGIIPNSGIAKQYAITKMTAILNWMVSKSLVLSYSGIIAILKCMSFLMEKSDECAGKITNVLLK